MIESLEYLIAEQRVRDYAGTADSQAKLMRDSREACDSMDCENKLRAGMEALAWIERFESSVNEAIASGVINQTDIRTLTEATSILYKMWREPCTFAEKWIAKCQKNGYDISNLVEFRDSCSRVQDWLERREWQARSAKARLARFAEEPWDVAHKAG